MRLYGGNLESHLMGNNLQQMTELTKSLCIYKHLDPRGSTDS